MAAVANTDTECDFPFTISAADRSVLVEVELKELQYNSVSLRVFFPLSQL